MSRLSKKKENIFNNAHLKKPPILMSFGSFFFSSTKVLLSCVFFTQLKQGRKVGVSCSKELTCALKLEEKAKLCMRLSVWAGESGRKISEGCNFSKGV